MAIFLTPYPANRCRIFFFLIAMLLSARSLAQHEAIEVVPSQPLLQTTDGNIVSTSVRVTNKTSAPQSFEASLLLPAGWKAIAFDRRFDIAPQQTDIRLISFLLPSATLAGTYDLHYAVKTNDTQASAAIRVEVRPTVLLEVKLIEAPRFIVAGEQYTQRFALTNRGNVITRVALSARSSALFATQLDSAVVHLFPQERRAVSVSVLTTADLPDRIFNTVELRVEVPRDSVVTSASGVVMVVPRVARAREQYLDLPLSAKLRTVGEDERVGTQLELSGASSLREDRTDRMEFLLRGPETHTRSALGTRDEYRVRYRNEFLHVTLGDWNYSLSPLTELARFGIGGEGMIALGDVTVGGFYNKTRWYASPLEQRAGYVQYAFLERYSFGVNYLHKNELFESDIVTLRGTARPVKQAAVDLELGRSRSAHGSDNAFAVGLTGSESWANFDLRYVHAGPKYTGYYRDLNFVSMSAHSTPLSGIRIETYFRQEERNLRRDSLLPGAPYDRAFQIGMGYKNFLSLYYRVTQQDDRLPIARYQRRENSVQTRAGYSLQNLNFFATVDYGVTHDRLTGRRSPSQRYALITAFQPSTDHTYTASLEYSTTRSLLVEERQKRYSLNLSAMLRLTDATRFQFGVYGSRTVATTRQTSVLYDLTLEHHFPFDHRIVIRGRRNTFTPSFNGTDVSYGLEYSVPLAVPLKRLSGSGQLRGKVLDADGRGIENVLLNVDGSAAITDRDGNFFFPSLTPEHHYLIVDRATIGLNRVTTQPMPLEVDIRGGEETMQILTVTHAASVSGNVVLYAFAREGLRDTATALVEVGGKTGIIIELSNGVEIHRRVSDNRGRFVFNDLRPGRWRLSVVGGEIPPFHYIEHDSTIIDLRPGDTVRNDLTILPRKRRVRIIQEGTVTLEQPKPSTAAEPPRTQTSEEFCLILFDAQRGAFIIQVSQWTTKANATARARVLENLTGYEATIEQADVPKLGTRYRAYLSPFPTREEAERVCRVIQKLGQD